MTDPDINLFHDFSWRFYYERGYGKHLEDAVKDFGIKVKQEDELSILEAIKKLKPYAKIYKTEDDDYGATWCVVWPDDPALRKEDMTLYYKEAVTPGTKEWIFLPVVHCEPKNPLPQHPEHPRENKRTLIIVK